MSSQFVAVKYRSDDKRTYTYENPGHLLFKGDIVKVPARSGDGWMKAIVDGPVEQPSFACKAIIGKWEPEPAPDPAREIDNED